MRRRLPAAVAAIFLVCAGAWAERTPGEPVGSEATMLTLLSRHLPGNRVVAVGHGYRMGADLKPPVFREGESVISRLQTISEAASDERHTLIPFRIRNTWVIASATRQEVAPDIGATTALNTASRPLLLRHVLGSLTPAQARRLGTEDGVAASSLPQESQAALSLLLRPPARIRYPAAPASGDDKPEDVPVPSPLDVSALSLRAHAWQSIVMLRYDENRFGFVNPSGEGLPRGPALAIPSTGYAAISASESRVNALVDAPNVLKPSDLDGRALTAPAGVSGVLRLEDLLGRLEGPAGRRLRADAPYRRAEVYVGSPDIPCGDVLEAIALALDSTWRKLGDTWVLAWDRRGLAAVQQSVREQSVAVRERVKALEKAALETTAWPAIAASAPFLPDDPLALTDEQRARLFNGTTPPAESEQSIAYDQMTPTQQAAVRKSIIGSKVSVTTLQPFGMEDRMGTAEDAEKAVLAGLLNVLVEINIPGVGWTDASGLGQATVNSISVRSIRAKAQGKNAEAWAKAKADLKLVRIHPPWSGLMVPPLPPARLATALAEMKRCGFKTLFYPALYNGYATFQTSAFPVSPAAEQTADLSAATAAAKKAGIALVAYIGTLSWRLPGNDKHWLDAHPGWVDRDVLGRTRLDWFRIYPRRPQWRNADPFLDTLADRDYVRPAEPEVRERLERLVDALSARADLSGIAFADWKPITGPSWDDALVPPPLGFTLPDRVAALQAMGRDPVDISVPNAPFLPDIPVAGVEISPTWANDTSKEDEALVTALTRRARARRNGWTTYRLDDLPDRGGESPQKGKAETQPDRVFAKPTLGGAAPLLFLPVPSEKDSPAPEVDNPLKGLPTIARFHAAQTSALLGLDRARAILYDFRACPDDITAALEWLYPENDE